MDWGKLRFFLSEVWRNFTRNVIMQLTAIGTVTVMILLLGALLLTREALAKIGQNELSKIEISVFLCTGSLEIDSRKCDRATPADAKGIIARLKRDPRVRNVTFIPQAEGLRLMRQRLRGQVDTSLLTSNPLPDALRIRVVEPSQVPAVAVSLEKLHGVATVVYQRDAVERLLRFVDVMGKMGLGFLILLLITAAIIISNTIRLTVYARRREIAIMQLVGASGTYIRLPFICEGFLAGVVGAIIALLLLGIGRWQLWPKFIASLPFLPLGEVNLDFMTFALQLLGIGASVGIVAAWLSVGRYLKT